MNLKSLTITFFSKVFFQNRSRQHHSCRGPAHPPEPDIRADRRGENEEESRLPRNRIVQEPGAKRKPGAGTPASRAKGSSFISRRLLFIFADSLAPSVCTYSVPRYSPNSLPAPSPALRRPRCGKEPTRREHSTRSSEREARGPRDACQQREIAERPGREIPEHSSAGGRRREEDRERESRRGAREPTHWAGL